MKKTTLITLMAALCCSCNVQVQNPDEKSYENHNWGNGNGNDVARELRLSPKQQQMLKQSNDFSLNLLRQTYKSDTGNENVLISPLSASMALGMLMNSAAGETLQQVKEGLGMADWTDEEVNEYYHLMLNTLPCLDTCTHLSLANSLWLKNGFPVIEDFIEVNKRYFMAQVENVDFTDPQTANLINDWADKHTNGLIKEVVSPAEIANCVAMLANALYFKGVWADKFDKAETKDADFKSSKGQTQVVDMMHKEGEMKYAEPLNTPVKMQIMELDYMGGAYCMDIFLPANDNEMTQLLEWLDSEYLTKMESTFWPWYEAHGMYEPNDTVRWQNKRDVNFFMPKFTLRYSKILNDDLKALGMTDMFNPSQADFSRLSNYPTYVSFVKQDTYMSVDEEGTEAAAVTVIGYNATSIEPIEIPVMRLDRPFVLLIRERQFGTILFAGVIGNPNEK